MTKRSKHTLKWVAVALVGVFAVGGAVAVQGPISAQDHGANGPNIPPGGTAKFVPQLRTVADMQAADEALAAAGGSGGEVPPFMPTNPAEYAAAKAAGRSGRGEAAPEATAADPAPLVPPTGKFMNWEGITGGAVSGNLAPPDTHGAVGNTQYAQIVNAAMRVFTKGTTTTQPTIGFGWVCASPRRASSSARAIHRSSSCMEIFRHVECGASAPPCCRQR